MEKNFLWIIFLGILVRANSQEVKIDSFYIKVAEAAEERCRHNVIYDPSYYSIEYPNGDVPAGKGVCTDLVIRTYRKIGIDLQEKVHQDMSMNFHLYPKIWGLKSPDSNIDHRRVPNLMLFFSRYGKNLPISRNPLDYKPGDIITWDLGGGLTHIGIVSNRENGDGNGWLIAHNIGNGPQLEDMLFDFKIIGHYRYNGK